MLSPAKVEKGIELVWIQSAIAVCLLLSRTQHREAYPHYTVTCVWCKLQWDQMSLTALLLPGCVLRRCLMLALQAQRNQNIAHHVAGRKAAEGSERARHGCRCGYTERPSFYLVWRNTDCGFRFPDSCPILTFPLGSLCSFLSGFHRKFALEPY